MIDYIFDVPEIDQPNKEEIKVKLNISLLLLEQTKLFTREQLSVIYDAWEKYK
jgi:hypothetical protein